MEAKNETEMTVDELRRAWEEAEPISREEAGLGDLAPAAPLVPITVRLPSDLLAELKSEAAKAGQPYQRYLRALLLMALREVQEGAPSPAPVQVIRLDHKQLDELAAHGSLTVQLRGV